MGQSPAERHSRITKLIAARQDVVTKSCRVNRARHVCAHSSHLRDVCLFRAAANSGRRVRPATITLARTGLWGPGGRRGRRNQRPVFKRQANLPSHLTREQQSDGWLVMRPARHRLRHMQEFVERDGAFHNGVTSATVHKELRVMVKDIDDEERLLHGTSLRSSVHTNLKISDPCQRNRRRVTLRAG